jgi:hypothetical protein
MFPGGRMPPPEVLARMIPPEMMARVFPPGNFFQFDFIVNQVKIFLSD